MNLLERPLVIKFGGTSVGGGAEFVRAARIAAEAAANRPVAVVVSAMGGTTDTLLGYARMSSGWVRQTLMQETHEASVAELRRALAERHLLAAREAVDPERLPEVEGRIVDLLGELEEVIEAPSDNLKARRDEIAVYGERLSAEILAGAISKQGVPASAVDADPIATDGKLRGGGGRCWLHARARSALRHASTGTWVSWRSCPDTWGARRGESRPRSAGEVRTSRRPC